ncbi:MAG: MOSC domain-containing protein [Bryobacteraceae bacterium]|nr:MOSC domain-containing protein [Bryobacteraceae bacterium]
MSRILSVQAGRLRDLDYRGQKVRTGIFKEPVSGPVAVRRLGLEGDQQADLRVHGGPWKAVYAYPSEHYARWRAEYPHRDFPYGFFGENLTIEGLTEDQLETGDLIRAGSALLQVTTPREPCFKLGTKFGDMQFIRRFAESGRSGFYLAVLEEGILEAGDPFERTLQ